MEETRPELRAILDQLLQVHHAARTLGEHEVAFHALSAAAHAAEHMHDGAALSKVARLSRDELEWLVRNDPRHRMVAGVATRNHQSMFEQLALTATAMRQRIESNALIEAARARVAAHGVIV
jgi:hypothetical protein